MRLKILDYFILLPSYIKALKIIVFILLDSSLGAILLIFNITKTTQLPYTRVPGLN